MGRFALVKDGVTKNVIVLGEGSKYEIPKGFDLVPEDLAPKYGTPYADIFAISEDLSPNSEKNNLEKFIELSDSFDYQKLDEHDGILRLSDNPRILGNDKCIITMNWFEGHVYEISMVVLEDDRNGVHGRSVLCSSIRWMFVNTDATLIFGNVSDKTIGAARIAESVSGNVVLKKGKIHYPIFALGKWCSAYGVEKALQEMDEAGNAEKSSRLRQRWGL